MAANNEKKFTIDPSEKSIVLRKAEKLYEMPFRDKYRIIFSPFTAGYSIALLTPELLDIFNAVDDNNNIENIIKKFIPRYGDDAEEIVAYSLDLFRNRNIIYTPGFESYIPINVEQIPRQVQVWVLSTNQCNLRCTYCYQDHTPRKMQYEQGKEYLTRIMEICEKNGVRELLIRFVGGEPLLNFNTVIKLADFVKKVAPRYNIQPAFLTITNGTLMTKHKAKILKERGFVTCVSIDGIEEINNKTRIYPDGKGTFKDIIKALTILKENGNEFITSIVASPFNVGSLDVLSEFLLNKGLCVSNFFLVRENCFCKISDKINKEDYINGLKKGLQVLKENPSPNRPQHLDTINLFVGAKIFTCTANRGFFAMDENGYVASCQFLLGHTKEKNHILDDNIEEKLFFNKEMNEIFCSVDERETCAECEWSRVCAGGCPTLTFNSYGTSKRPFPYCDIIKELIPELLEIEAATILKYEDFYQVTSNNPKDLLQALKNYKGTDLLPSFNTPIVPDDYDDTVIENCKKAIEINPENPDFYCQLASAYVEKKEYNLAIETSRQAIEICPDYHWSHNSLGWAYFNKKEYILAIDCFKRALSISPDFEQAWINLMDCYLYTKDYDNAVEICKQAIEINPKNPDYYCQLASAYVEKKEYDLSIEISRQAIEICPDYHWSHNSLGWAYFNKKEYILAIDCFKRALSISPDLEPARKNLMDCYLNIKDYDNATKVANYKI